MSWLHRIKRLLTPTEREKRDDWKPLRTNRRDFLKLAGATSVLVIAPPDILGSEKDKEDVKPNEVSFVVHGVEKGDRVAAWVMDGKEIYRDEEGRIHGLTSENALYNDRSPSDSVSITYKYRGDAECLVRVRNGGYGGCTPILPFQSVVSPNQNNLYVPRIKDG